MRLNRGGINLPCSSFSAFPTNFVALLSLCNHTAYQSCQKAQVLDVKCTFDSLYAIAPVPCDKKCHSERQTLFRLSGGSGNSKKTTGCSGIGRRLRGELTRDVEQDCEEEKVMKVEGNIQGVWEGIVPLAPRPHHGQGCKIEHHLTLGRKGQRGLKVAVQSAC